MSVSFLPADDVRDERALMGVTAGVLWLVAAITAGIGALLPGSPAVDATTFVVLEVFVAAYAIACITGKIRWADHSMRTHALVTAALLPLIGLAIWATGGAESFVLPLALFPLLHIAYFFEPKMSVPLVFELVLVYAAPLVYTSGTAVTHEVFPARLLTMAVGATLMVFVVRMLKKRLISAEMRQREMALTDALTGLVNRRGFDHALTGAIARRGAVDVGRRSADDTADAVLLLIDLDDFKHVNDSLGHAAGDDLLRTVAAHCHAVVRPGDTVARIGGDEFAVIAPGAGPAGAERLAAALSDAIEHAGSHATIAWASHPQDGDDEDALLRAADRRLYEGKAERRKFEPDPALHLA